MSLAGEKKGRSATRDCLAYVGSNDLGLCNMCWDLSILRLPLSLATGYPYKAQLSNSAFVYFLLGEGVCLRITSILATESPLRKLFRGNGGRT